MKRRTPAPKPGPIRELAAPRLQLSVVEFAESFVCRRCVTNYAASHEKFDAPLHFHPEVELLLIEESHGMRYVADSIERYGPGDLVLIGPNIPHVFMRDAAGSRGGKPESSIVVQFRLDFMGEKFFERPELHDVRRLIGAADHGLHFGRQTVRWAGPRLQKMLELSGAQRLAALLELLALLVKAPARPLATSAFRQRVRQEDFARIGTVLDYAHAHFHEDVSMAAAARLVSLTPTSFSRWFSKATGKPFVQFLTDLRLAHAYRALTETGKPITQIAYDCGFNSVSHFIHRFRALRGMSPREFRQRVTSGRGES